MRSIAILAGGRATRFDGLDKSALLVDGRTILDRQLAELSSLTNDVMIVASGDARLKGSRSLESTEAGVHAEGARAFSTSARARHERATVDAPKRLRREGGQASVRVIRDIVPGCGPLGGLHAALTAALGDAVFVVACDMPYVTAAFAEYLFSLAGDAQIVVPRTERGYHPLCAVYARACLGPVAARLAHKQLALRDLVNDVPVRVVTDNEIVRFGALSRLLANVNTPAEYADLEALQGHKL